MSVRATVTYNLTHPNEGGDETIEVEISTDAPYSPDIAEDLAVRARSSLTETIAIVWPVAAP